VKVKTLEVSFVKMTQKETKSLFNLKTTTDCYINKSKEGKGKESNKGRGEQNCSAAELNIETEKMKLVSLSKILSGFHSKKT
jgi:hypothetical protein